MPYDGFRRPYPVPVFFPLMIDRVGKQSPSPRLNAVTPPIALFLPCAREPFVTLVLSLVSTGVGEGKRFFPVPNASLNVSDVPDRSQDSEGEQNETGQAFRKWL